MQTAIKPWKLIRSKILLHNRYVRIDEDVVELPDKSRRRYYIESRGVRAVVIIALNEKKYILCQKEYRHPVSRIVYEFPGGVVEKNESPLQAAKRELREEGGIIAKKWQLLGTYAANPSRSAVTFWVYLAKGSSYVGQQLDDGEYIAPEWMPEKKLRKHIKTGRINGQGVLSAYLLFSLHKPNS